MTVAGVASLSSLTADDNNQSATDTIQAIDLGVRPEVSSPGGVLVRKNKLMFLSFFATKQDEGGVNVGEGNAVIEFQGPVDWKFRSPGDVELAAHSIDLEELDVCGTYEVLSSSWVGKAESAMGKFDPPIRHFIFTFCGVLYGAKHFECLAQDLKVDLFGDATFDDILDYMTFRDKQA